jgi:ferredoxin-NADP reductase/DMSO/TMAO reductase YedYZ heme-binding membrane subunit
MPARPAPPARPTTAAQPAAPTVSVSGFARPALPSLVLSLIGLGVVAVLALWWKDTPPTTNRGELLTDAGDILGLLSGYGFVVLVALMARLPPLERGIGTDRLARWHAMGGRYVITLITGHVVFIVWGYAVSAHESVTSETATLLTAYPDVLMATVSFFLLLGIAAFSARAARRRLSYETWYYAHLYTYLAMALAFSHQFAVGPSFVSSVDARFTWSAMYITVAVLIVWYRVVTPLRMAARHRFTVMAVEPEAPGIVSVYISGRDLHRLGAEPGQFFRWRFLAGRLAWQSHPYSLSAMPRRDMLRITVKAQGDHSDSMAQLRPGTRVIAEGPYGAFTPSLSGRRVLLIAGGVGITPIRAMFAALPADMPGAITLIYRASHPRDVVFRRELDAIAADRGVTVHYLIGSRAGLGYDPLDARELQDLVTGLHRYEAYVCGPPSMTEAAIASLRDAGIPRHRIHHESFDF